MSLHANARRQVRSGHTMRFLGSNGSRERHDSSSTRMLAVGF
jgi:hypothetical protein